MKMSSIQDVGNVLFQDTNTNSQQSIPSQELDRDDFMLLFITQLEYQDPLNPLDTNEMATQLALFNQIDQLYSISDQMQNLVSLGQDQEIVNYSLLVGRLVKTESQICRVEDGQFLGANFSLYDSASDVQINIYSLDGQLIKNMDLGGIPAGNYQIYWDATDNEGNPVPDGDYVISLDINGSESQQYTIETVGRITGAYLGEDDSYLIFNDQENISLDDIEEILG